MVRIRDESGGSNGSNGSNGASIKRMRWWRLARAVVGVASSSGFVLAEFDLVGELVVELELGVLGERAAGDRLEGQLHVEGLLGAGLEVGDAVLALAPLLRALRRHGAVLQVHLVAEDDEGEVVGVARRRLDEELVAPRLERLEGGGRGDVEDQHTAVGAAIEGHPQRLEPLLARRVPDLHRHRSVVHHHLLRQEVRSDRRLVLVRELVVHELVHQRRLAHSAVSQDDHLQQHLLARRHFPPSLLRFFDSPTHYYYCDTTQYDIRYTQYATRNERRRAYDACNACPRSPISDLRSPSLSRSHFSPDALLTLNSQLIHYFDRIS